MYCEIIANTSFRKYTKKKRCAKEACVPSVQFTKTFQRRQVPFSKENSIKSTIILRFFFTTTQHHHRSITRKKD